MENVNVNVLDEITVQMYNGQAQIRRASGEVKGMFDMCCFTLQSGDVARFHELAVWKVVVPKGIRGLVNIIGGQSMDWEGHQGGVIEYRA